MYWVSGSLGCLDMIDSHINGIGLASEEFTFLFEWLPHCVAANNN